MSVFEIDSVVSVTPTPAVSVNVIVQNQLLGSNPVAHVFPLAGPLHGTGFGL